MSRSGAVILVLLLGLAPAGAAGAPEPQPYHIDCWEARDGLPQSSITSIVQTRDGYLWFGTFGGLVRFDGVQFKVFTPNNAPGLPSSRILGLFEDRQGELWIGTEEGYLVRYAEGRFQVCSPPGWARMSGYVQSFAETADGDLWLISPQHQLIRFAEKRFMAGSTNWTVLATNVNYMACDAQGQIWINKDNGIDEWRDGRFERIGVRTPPDDVGPCILAGSHSGGCWVVANGRLRKYQNGRWVVDYGAHPWLKGDADCMFEDSQGQVWVGTYGSGLYRYDTNGAVLHLSTKEGLPGDFIRAICQDREGNLWVGTEGYGLVRLKPALFRSYGRAQGLSGDCVLSVCQGDDGSVWVGTIANGVDRLKDGVVRHYGARAGLTNQYIWSVFEDRSHTLWVGTWGGGLYRLMGDRFVPFDNPGECAGIVCALYEDSSGSLWVGQQRPEAEVVHLVNGKPVVLRLQSHFAGIDVRAITEDKDGNIWLGTQGDGLYRIKDGRQTHFGKREGLSNESISSLYADPDGVLWIATYGGGLNRLENGKFTVFTTKDGLVNDALGYVTEDHHGYLWCASLGGVFRVSKEDLNRFAHGRIHSIHCYSYTESDGMPSRECSGRCQPSGCETRDGRLWFPTIRGLAVVNPDDVPVNTLPPPVAIEEVVIEGKTRTTVFDPANSVEQDSAGAAGSRKDAELRLPPGTQRLEFRYTGLSLTAPAKVRFKYKLEGVEEDWVDAGTRRTANYSHLKPGRYRFRVLACNNDGVWNPTGAALSLVILPHFWQTWWFRALCVVAAILLFVAAYELRLASERKLARMRLRIASDLHDEVGGNLGSIALLSEMLPKEPPAHAEEINEIRRIALQTVASLRDIVWFLDPAADNMNDLIVRMKETARTMLPGIAFDFRVEGQAGAAAPSLHLRRNVFPMFKEILHNIAKHAHADRVEIVAEVNSRQLRLSIRDNGVGFDESSVRAGNGLKNLRRRAAELRGTLEVHSQPGQGTRVSLLAPIP